MMKQDLRRSFLSLRDALPERAEKSEKIGAHILSYTEREKPSVIFAYVAFRSEPDTKDLICRLLDMGKTVALPKCRKDGGMDFYAIRGFSELSPGAYGILEPGGETPVLPEEADLVLVPGCAFDREGFRLGYGGGYYDRYLPKCRKATRLGVCFSACVTDKLPRENFDCKMDILVTENGLMNIL